MATTTVTRRLAARPERVFAVATDFRNLPTIITAIKDITMLTEGSARVGTRFRETRIVRGKPGSVDWEVTAWVPNKSWVIASKIPGTIVTCEHVLRPVDDHTELNLTLHAHASGLLGLLTRFFLGKMVAMCEAEMHGDLEQLAKACEA